MPDRKSFAERLKFAEAWERFVEESMHLTGRSMREWGREAGVSHALISRHKSGIAKQPDIGFLLKMWDSSGLSIARIADLFGEVTLETVQIGLKLRLRSDGIRVRMQGSSKMRTIVVPDDAMLMEIQSDKEWAPFRPGDLLIVRRGKRGLQVPGSHQHELICICCREHAESVE